MVLGAFGLIHGTYYIVITYEVAYIWYISMACFDMVWHIILYGWFNIYVWHIIYGGIWHGL
jgi:hypothetical protein